MADIKKLLMNFHSNIFNLIRILKKMDPDNINIDFIKNKVSIARRVDEHLIISIIKDKILDYSDDIICRKTDLLFSKKSEELINAETAMTAEYKKIAFEMLDLIKKNMSKMDEDELEDAWTLLSEILKSVIIYKQITGDHL